MRNKRIPVNYRNKKSELQFMYVSGYFQACMMPKEQCASVVLISADVKYFESFVVMIVIHSELCLLLCSAKNSTLAAIAEEKRR